MAPSDEEAGLLSTTADIDPARLPLQPKDTAKDQSDPRPSVDPSAPQHRRKMWLCLLEVVSFNAIALALIWTLWFPNRALMVGLVLAMVVYSWFAFPFAHHRLFSPHCDDLETLFWKTRGLGGSHSPRHQLPIAAIMAAWWVLVALGYPEMVLEKVGLCVTSLNLVLVTVGGAVAYLCLYYLVAYLTFSTHRLDKTLGKDVPRMLALVLPLLAVIFFVFGLFPEFWRRLLGDYYKAPDAFDRLTWENLADWPAEAFFYVLWGTFQQSVYLAYMNSLLQPLQHHRVVMCLLNGFFFCLIHIPSSGLMALTFCVGTVWAFFWSDGAPNLLVYGAIHGILGSFSEKILPVQWSVGPKAVH